jgi:hypothetical protein|tara:strand:- start:272 stop:457 length:186 start_codon:yes stop_codon:yes gene_type:complete
VAAQPTLTQYLALATSPTRLRPLERLRFHPAAHLATSWLLLVVAVVDIAMVAVVVLVAIGL